MANKAIFSYGNGGKRKIGHSKFDMGFEHIMSSNFGGLHPVAVFETLPDDYWEISDNTVTLLKPLTAPAFTRINQNWYGAYVRNQQIWKYWNDYISNGTAFGDVYGNNVTNQSLQNAWDVPSIPTPYLQSILKIGFGNATPVFRDVFTYNPNASVPQDRFAAFIYRNTTFENVTDETVYRITDLVYLLLQLDPSNSSILEGDALRMSKIIDLTHYAFDVHMVRDSSGVYYFLFELYCSLRQFLAFQSCFGNVLNNIANPTGSENISDDYSIQGNNSYEYKLAYRFFADCTSPDPTTSQSAFLIEKVDYEGSVAVSLKSLDYYPRHVDSQLDLVFSDFRVTGISRVYQSISSPYWGFRYGCWSNTQYSWIESSGSFDRSFNANSSFWWHVDATSLFGISYPNDFQSLFDSFIDSIHYLGVTTTSWIIPLENFGDNLSYSITFGGGSVSYGATGFGRSSQTAVFSPFIINAACDLTIPFTVLVDGPFTPSPFAPENSICTRDSRALGYDATSCLTYLCHNSSILLDSFGIKVDPLSQRPFSDYRFELTNALPFFAYSKIWNDNLRNSVVSSPELDYSESNSVIFADGSFYSYFVFNSQFAEPAVRPSRYQNKVASDFKANGWTLEITTFPRNSQGSAIHTHLPIKSFMDVFRILVGHDFDSLFISLSTTELNVFDYYSPSYYNGLLHLKFQNFNKDYFTSALLDPMSGANQVAVGSTINELRENEAKQHWWERTAVYRSIKNWFQGTYGITPIELPEDSRITGTDHIDVQIGEVIQTSGTTPESPQGTRSGLGGARGSGVLCHGHANEHGWIIILCSHTIESQYMQVYDKMWDVKESFLDYPTIDFAGIGNESILQKELNFTTVPSTFYDSRWITKQYSQGVVYAGFLPTIRSASTSYRGQTNPIRKTSARLGKYNIAQNAGTSLDNVFGFIPRYSSYKFKFDQVSGQFRNELKFWHTFKRYLTMPILCHEFVNWEMAADDDDINRIFAVSDDFLDDKFAIDCFINASVDRALPFVCVPSSR